MSYRRNAELPNTPDPRDLLPYTVATGMTQSNLETNVTILMANGYEPRGGVCIARDGMLYQAMIRTGAPAAEGEVKLREPKRTKP